MPHRAVAAAPDAASNFAQPWSYSNERDVFGTVRGEYDFNENVTAWAAFGARHGNEDNALANTTAIDGAGTTSVYRFDNARRHNVRTGEIGIHAKLRTGGIGHTLSASASAFRLDSRNAYAASDFAGFASWSRWACATRTSRRKATTTTAAPRTRTTTRAPSRRLPASYSSR